MNITTNKGLIKYNYIQKIIKGPAWLIDRKFLLVLIKFTNGVYQIEYCFGY